jgi:hypothetical protein
MRKSNRMKLRSTPVVASCKDCPHCQAEALAKYLNEVIEDNMRGMLLSDSLADRLQELDHLIQSYFEMRYELPEANQ